MLDDDRAIAMGSIILAGDIGGSKTHLGLFELDGGDFQSLRDEFFVTPDFKSLEDVAALFLGPERNINAACFGVPGPVIDGRSHATNVKWLMEAGALSRALGIAQTHLMNDLEASAYGVPHLNESEILTLHRGEARGSASNIAVIAAGTGLGEAALVATPGGYHAVATEGGHCGFAPADDDDQRGLLAFLAREFGHVSFERVLSGPGLHNIYRYLLTAMTEEEPHWVAQMIREADPAAAISELALAERDRRCVRALELFVTIYGIEASNLALKYLSLGGVYLCGGIAPKIQPFLQHQAFLDGFLAKGRLRPTLERIPVKVSLNPSTALIGAAAYAANTLL
jgi:glucokinase